MQKKLDAANISALDKRYRVNLINSLSGFKSANLIGTADASGHTNLAIFSSVIHMGSDPPLFGFVTRPTVVPRHTYMNIQETGHFTLNHIHQDIFRSAHQTAARYPREISEFQAVGLTAEYSETLQAPYVAESSIKMGLKLVEEHKIAANGTHLMIGQVLELYLPINIIQADGYVDIESAKSVCISGLDTYHKTGKMDRLPYAKP